MKIYFDSSALIKRSIVEAESAAFVHVLDERARAGDELLSSSICEIEVSRVIRAHFDHVAPQIVRRSVESALAGVTTHPLDAQVVDVARLLGPSSLRSLDAIHLASAALLGADLVCAYDRKLLEAAAELGFRTISPV